MKIKPFPLILILLLVAFTSSYAQSYKMIYDFQWKSNKKSPEYNSELCALITRENNQPSFFESYENFRLDSLKTKVINDYAKNNRQGPLRLPSDEKKSLFRPLIIKNPADKTITVEEKAYVKLFSVAYSCPIKWKIQSNDKETILGYKAQKAVCEFGGRNWTAWFTNEIPIMDGPYKFSGLPGLIIQMYDSKRHWNIDFAQLLYKDTKRIDLPFKDAIKKDKVKIFKDKREYSLNSLQKLEAAGILSFDIKDRAQLFEENRKKAERDNNWIEMYP